MYVKDQPIVITWEIKSASEAYPAQDYFDIVIVDPEGDTTYLVDPFETYVAPNAVAGIANVGVGTYTFTPTERGRWRIKLVTGSAAAYDTLDYINMYVQGDCITPIQPATPYILTHGCAGVIYTGWVEYEGGWYGIGGMSEDPRDSSVLWVVGDRAGVGGATLVKHDKATGAIITEQHTLPFLNTCSLDIMADGTIVVQRLDSAPGNIYMMYYSTDDGANWTICTTNSATYLHGPGNAMYDPTLDGIWWASGAAMYYSPNGQDYYRQSYIDGVFGELLVASLNHFIMLDDGTAFLVGQAGSGNVKSFYPSTATPPATGYPTGDFSYHEGIWGALSHTSKCVGLLYNNDRTKLVALSQNGVVSSAEVPLTGGSWTAVDHAILTGTMQGMMRLGDTFYATNTSDTWWESTDDGDNWVLGSAPVAGATIRVISNNADSTNFQWADGGHCFVNDSAAFDWRVHGTIE